MITIELPADGTVVLRRDGVELARMSREEWSEILSHPIRVGEAPPTGLTVAPALSADSR